MLLKGSDSQMNRATFLFKLPKNHKSKMYLVLRAVLAVLIMWYFEVRSVENSVLLYISGITRKFSNIVFHVCRAAVCHKSI